MLFFSLSVLSRIFLITKEFLARWEPQVRKGYREKPPRSKIPPGGQEEEAGILLGPVLTETDAPWP